MSPPAICLPLRSAWFGSNEERTQSSGCCRCFSSISERRAVITTVLGPERWRRHLLNIQSVVARSVAEYEGYIHNYEGDAVLASFSFPRTHEDDARRAVLCGLNIMSKSREITSVVNAECAAEGSDDRFSMRVGIDSGRVVVGPSGSPPSINAADLVGEAVNFAARLQHYALRTGVAISERTNAFVRGYFLTEPEGPIDLRSFSRQVIHHVVRSTGAEDRLQATAQRTPLVGPRNGTVEARTRLGTSPRGRTALDVRAG